MTIGAPTRIMTFLRCNLAALIVGLMVIALPVAMQSPQRADAAPISGFTKVETSGYFTCATKSDATVWCGETILLGNLVTAPQLLELVPYKFPASRTSSASIQLGIMHVQLKQIPPCGVGVITV
jgi:hypothetical protein